MSTNPTQGNDPFFRPIGQHVEDDEQQTTGEDGQPPKMVEEIESLCMRCEQNGVTRLLMTYIPYFKEVLVASFLCEHCGERNNEIQSAGEIQEKGCIYTVHINNASDLNRQVVKSGSCTVNIPELAIEIPPKRGQLTTIEGLVSDTLRDLELDQPLRKHMQPEAYEKIEVLCNKLRDILGEDRSDAIKPAGGEAEAQEDAAGSSAQAQAAEAAGIKSHGPVGGSNARQEGRTFPPFSIRLDDPSGNSFVEFLGTIQGRGVSDAKWTKRDYPRTRAQNEMLGLAGPADPNAKPISSRKVASLEEAAAAASSSGGGFSKSEGETDFENEEIYTFPGACSSCNAPLDTLMKKVNIPYFKDVIIMSTNCDFCGYRDNEVKSGTAISERGRKLTLKVEDAEDLTRDILKSESAGFSIPEIDLNLSPGTLGGRFTTLEGLLQQVYDELSERVLMRGDSSSNSTAFEGFLGKLKAVMSGEACPFTVILDDPLASSYLQNPYAPDVDEQLTIEDYDRTWEQNEDLGLNDINVEEYKSDGEESHALGPEPCFI
ncbi:putative ZPR1-protein binds to translation elongation factor eEF-1 [Microstroma glucosiphilum]|uniref:Putative ZPR1-protein binds to translation elongation factor eEF-1 n=1 Tax=Pseudomicrostroma glucosiphilum TaxID=1684307 RepID=A0A316U7Q5_9BASI|nr:putative ZPR1-protein binds to translation elongation factor eEF-1 [Pseudomicrostroma glucosiphilum]PWN18985.1 putative ZPR1-protein binds to translation elongation factor eEF-1 [Pseudomicrostroma glucosiphilum]